MHLIQCQSESASQTERKRSPGRSARQHSSRHHFCVDHTGADSTEDDHCSQSAQSDASSNSVRPSDTIPSGQSHHIEHDSTSRQASPSAGHLQKSSHSSRADQAYEAYKVSAINKLVNELAHKQQECRKAKLHAVVSILCDKSA